MLQADEAKERLKALRKEIEAITVTQGANGAIRVVELLREARDIGRSLTGQKDG